MTHRYQDLRNAEKKLQPKYIGVHSINNGSDRVWVVSILQVRVH